MKIKLLEKFSYTNDNRKKLAFIILCAVVSLTFALIPKNEIRKADSHSVDITYNESDYVLQLENRLSETVAMIDGAGKARVMITLASSGETVYMSNAKLDESTDTVYQTRTTSEKSLATMKNGSSNETPVIVKQLSPKISGVLIVCEGGENQNVKNNIIKAASTALDVSSSRIYVTGGEITK